MPVYNGGRYFQLALTSALAQDYANLEVLVVNDGSLDDGETERIARSAGDRVRYMQQENRGVAGALNTAVVHMTGDYFAWLSHDDLHVPQKTKAQVAYLTRLGRPAACLFSDYDLIGPSGEPISTVRLPAKRIRRNPRLPLYNGMINGCTLLIPAQIMRAFGPFDERLRCTQDYDLWNRILAHHEFFHQPEVLVHYRIHPGQGTSTSRATAEGNVLWTMMLASRTEVERAQMFGSTQRYFTSLATFLDGTPYQEAATRAHVRAASTDVVPLVSVVLPFFNEVELVLRAVQSVRGQTHGQVEIVLVNDGSSDDISAVEALAEVDSRIRLLRQPRSGKAAANNNALRQVQGDYIAFLEAGSIFESLKIERQLSEMQREGAVFSHTSYHFEGAGHTGVLNLVRSGSFGGSCFPQIIGDCKVATPTVMIHRSLIDGGFAFATAYDAGADVLAWIDLAMRYTLLGIDEPLSLLEWSDERAPLNYAAEVRTLSEIVEALRRHPIYHRYRAEIDKLLEVIRTIAAGWIAAGRKFPTADNRSKACALPPSHAPVPPARSGRVRLPRANTD